MLLLIIFKDLLHIWLNFSKRFEHWHMESVTHFNISILIMCLFWIDGRWPTNVDQKITILRLISISGMPVLILFWILVFV